MIKFILLLNLLHNYFVYSIDCFKCISFNNDYKPCEDPFHHNYTDDIYKSPCMGGKKGRNGMFPATSCVKIAGIFDDNQDSMLVRGCALDSGSLTTDTEIVRMSHCGSFFYENRYVRGCVQSCNDADGCNIGNIQQLKFLTLALYMLLILKIIPNLF